MPALTDAFGEQRYELNVDGYAAFVTYAREGDCLILIHTEVPSELQGRGIGSALARSVLSEARDRHLRVEPRCEFIAGFIQRHPEFTDLVAPGGREQPLR
jgi:predicted GNAT family acetyltransferase